jgi:hypothetical protein
VETAPAVQITGHERVWAGWVDPTEAMRRPLLPHIAAYLAARGRNEGQKVRT